MSNKYKIRDNEKPYFVTMTTVGWDIFQYAGDEVDVKTIPYLAGYCLSGCLT